MVDKEKGGHGLGSDLGEMTMSETRGQKRSKASKAVREEEKDRRGRVSGSPGQLLRRMVRERGHRREERQQRCLR